MQGKLLSFIRPHICYTLFLSFFLSSILPFIRSLNGSTEEGEDPLRDYFIDAAIALAPQYADAVRQGDLDRATGYARIYGDAGCSYAQYLVRCTAPRALQFTEVAVEVARHPDREVHLLVLAYFDELAAAVNAALPEQRLALASPFVPHVRRLVGHLIGHLVLPADLAPVFCSDDSCNGDNGSNTGNGKGGGEEEEEEEGGNGDKEDVARYRKYDIGQCLSAYCALAAPSGVLGVAMQAFSEALTHLSTDWRPAEAAVYALQCVAARASPPCSELAPLLKPFLDAAPGLLVPSGARGSAALRRTALVAVGAYAGYFRGAAFLPQLLDGVATALGAGPALRPAAAVAFARLCDACAADLSPYAAQFETLYGRCCGQLQPPLALTARQAEDVAQGLCSVILAMPRGKAAPLLDAYCAATATELQAAVQAAATAAAAASAGSATPALLGVLGRLRVFLSCAASWAGSSCEPGTLAAAGQRVVACLRTVFPAVGALVAAGPQLCTPEVVGAVVSVYDAAIGTSERTAGFVESILPGMFEAPVRHYTAQPNALDLSFANGILTRLKLASDAVTNPVVRNILVSVLATVVAATTQFLGNTRGAAQEHPDLIEGFFGFMDTFASKHPGLVAAQGTILQDTVAMAAAVLALTQHPGATRIICAFLCTVLRAAHTVQALRAPVDCCLLRLGARVVHALLCGVAGAQPKDFVHSAATVVFQVRAYSRDTLLALVAACLELQQPPPQFTSCGKFPVALDQETRTMFLTKLQKAASSKNVENVMNDFGFACRSLITAL